MLKRMHKAVNNHMNDTARLCFGVAAGAAIAAVFGLIAGNVYSGSLAASGMAAIALFYLVLGLFSLGKNRHHHLHAGETPFTAVETKKPTQKPVTEPTPTLRPAWEARTESLA
ncbi:hypothetical protein GC163_03435 [bacterium]|nr:hypothetical protein [bacterium]